tara:strand:- start:5 stop:535 length:531 start_codon:yes stop_codon:yes gene_type:complete
MEPRPLSKLDLYVMLKAWVRPRLSWFPRWTFDDIVHEAYLVAIEKMVDFDPAKGTVCTYLTPRLFDPIWTKYMHHEGYRIERTREDGKWMRRRTIKILFSVGRVPDTLAETSEPWPQDGPFPPMYLYPAPREVADLIMRGLSPAQVARSRGVSISAIVQILARMRRNWPTSPQDGL